MASQHRSSRRRSAAKAYGARRINQRKREALPTKFDHTLLEIEIVRAVASYTDLYAIADLIPDRAPNSPGRPAHYPAWVSVIHKVLHGVFGSANKASRIMAYPDYWDLIREYAAKSGKSARVMPPRRHHHVYALERLDAYTEQLREGLRDTGVKLALQIGCLRPDKPVSRTDPDRGQAITIDGTVAGSPWHLATIEKKRAAGKPAVNAHLEVQNGDDGKTFGLGFKVNFALTRPDSTPNKRAILDAAPVPPGKGYRGEAGVSEAMIDDIVARPDVRVDAICYDGAFRGKHIDHVMKKGLIALVPTHAGTAKPAAHRTIDCGCGDKHTIWTKDGRLHERIILDTGETNLQPLPVSKVYDRRNRNGTHRWYIEYAALCGTVYTDRIDNTEDDAKRGYNRAEHLRQYTKSEAGDGLYDRCYGWREDSESLNNTLDRTMYGGRVTAYSATRQHSVMIGFALGRNAIAAFIHHKQAQLEAI
jgi:hypothetical protein